MRTKVAHAFRQSSRLRNSLTSCSRTRLFSHIALSRFFIAYCLLSAWSSPLERRLECRRLGPLVYRAVACFAALFVAPIALALFSGVLGSPFLLILLFLLLRGFFSDIIGSHRAKAAFKQNLESATLNPADASAHYNLGLIHQSRGELDAGA